MTQRLYRVRTATKGALFLMAAPPSTTLRQHISHCRTIGVAGIVSFLATQEALDLGLGEEAAVCAEHDIDFVHFPVEDFGIPDIEAFRVLVERIAGQLSDGTTIALHCRAGIGRTGTAASCILQRLGHAPEDAIERVTAARRTKVPDTLEQEAFIRAFRQS